MKDMVKVSWVFDVISPFAYLAFPQLSRLPAHVSVEFVPVLFAGLLQHFGQLGPAEIPSKRRFTYRFALWRARQLGLPMRMPPAHPFNPLAALRLIIAAGSDQRAAGTVLDARVPAASGCLSGSGHAGRGHSAGRGDAHPVSAHTASCPS